MKLQYPLLTLLFLIFQNSIAQNNGLTPLDVAKIQSVTAPAISPDGKYAAYLLTVPADPLKENRAVSYHLYSLNISTGESTALVTNQSAFSPSFRSSDAVTYLSANILTGKLAMYEIAISGGEPKLIFEHSTSIKEYDWSSDGSKVLFTAKPLPQKQTVSIPYQPEIFEENLISMEAYVVNLNDGKAARVNVSGSVYMIKWSPDDSKVAISASPTPLVDDKYVNQKIYIADANSLQKTAEISHQAKLQMFDWSPDGSQLVMVSGAHVNDPIAGRLMTVSASGGEPTMIMEGYPGMAHKASWVKKNTIHVLTSTGCLSEFKSINPNSSKSKLLSSVDGEEVWTDFASSGSTTIFKAHSPKHPYEIYVSSNFGETKRLTNSNPWLDDKALGAQQIIKYPARDGLEVEGILIRPVGEKPGEKYPLITIVHGGPESHIDHGWNTVYSRLGQVAAANGYAVFYPNYRGSTGRGIEFTMSSQADQSGKEFDDIVDGVDYLIASGLVDKDKVGVTGGSYGGFATAWMSTYYSDRFAAGVMSVGISNHISKWGTSDIPEEMFNVHARSRVWDDYDDWLKRSPIYHVEKAQTPLLIMHGKEDTRVHPGQSMELYRHIKTRTETPVRLVLYPGEGHGNRKSTARLDFSLRSLRWFNYYLKDVKEDLNAEVKLEGE